MALVLGAVGLAVCGQGVLPRNGAMEGPGVDHTEGKGLLVTPEGWTPVNINTGRGDRLSVEPSDRPGGGQCLHVKTFGSDAGVYQTLAPLEKGRTYLVSAWVKRLSGSLAVEAYPYAWGPAAMRRVDSVSTGWTRLVVGLTAIDGGAHLYLVAFPKAEFLIDDVRIVPAAVQVGAPEAQPYDFAGHWRYRVALERLAGATAPREVAVRAIGDGSGRPELSPARRVALPQTGPTTVELQLPLEQEGTFTIEVSDPQTGEPVGGSPMAPLFGSPWVIHYPHKNALFAGTGYQWPLRIEAARVEKGRMARLRATARIISGAGKAVRTVESRLSGNALVLPLAGRNIAPGSYRLAVSVQDQKGRRLLEETRPLRILPKAEHEVVVSPEGDTLVNGKRFFPIGLYWVFADPAGWKPGPARKLAEIRELREAGFNTLHTYAFEHNDAHDTDENALAYLDMAQEYGFKVMMGLRRDWCQVEKQNHAAIEARVRKLKGHPALLCWTLWDEPDFDTANVPRVQAIYDIVDRIDPYHPAMPVFMSAGGRPFRACADVNLFDCYPGKGNTGILPGVLRRAKDAIPEKPIWYVAQAFRSGTQDEAPVVTKEDMRSSWQHALDAGAKGIWWYSYGGDGKAWDSVRCEPEHWENVRAVVQELARKVE